MSDLKSYMIPEMIADKKCNFFGYVSFANGTDQERVVSDVAIRPRNQMATFQTLSYKC